jgi:hypothetical protein
MLAGFGFVQAGWKAENRTQSYLGYAAIAAGAITAFAIERTKSECQLTGHILTTHYPFWGGVWAPGGRGLLVSDGRFSSASSPRRIFDRRNAATLGGAAAGRGF